VLVIDDFRAMFPEFASAEDELVTACLLRAETQIAPEIWLDQEDEGHGLLTAHILALSPNGQMARMTSDGKTTYGTEYVKLREQVTALVMRVP
jgi:hypothetical protein